MPLPTDEAEFQRLMEDVDRTLSEQGVSIVFRPLAGLREVAMRTGQDQTLPTPEREPTAGVYSGPDLAIRVRRWFEHRYADSLQMDFSLGSTAILLRGAAWHFKVPLFAGTFRLTAAPTEPSDPVVPGPDVGPPSRFNVLGCIQGLGPRLRATITPQESRYLLHAARIALEGFKRICDAFRFQLVQEARTDYAAAAQHLHGQYTHPGQSKWASLQAAEKMLKALILARGEAPPHSHELKRIAGHAHRLGLPDIPDKILEAVQTDAGARYGDTDVALADAVRANHAAVIIGAVVAGTLTNHPFPPDLTRVDA